jgi:zinc finger FYVE domain-containing protein 26
LSILDGGKKRVKSVTFVEDKEEETNEQSSQSSDINIERWRDISIFSGYCAIRNVMDAIYFCVDYSDSNLMNPVHKKDYRSHSLLSCSDSGNENCHVKSFDSKKSNFQEIYTKNVTEKLLSTREYLSKLQPLTYRVEILQDIFSLLFVKHECIQESAFYEDIESDDCDDDRSRHSTVDDMHINNMSEDSLTSSETLSPAINQQQVFILPPDDPGTMLVGSYDEPFQDRKTTRKKLVARRNSFTQQISDQKLDRASDEIIRNMSSDNLNDKITDLQTENIVSETGSTFSTDSSLGLFNLGFLNNEYLVRDILNLLKDALFDLETAQFQIRGSTPEKNNSQRKKPQDSCYKIIVSLEEPLTNIIQCSVTKETLHSKVSKLRTFISEASWRFQLVCYDKIPKKPGEVLLGPVIVSMELHEEEICTDLIGPKERKKGMCQGNRLCKSNTAVLL